ncbi:EAL domain-containing protein [Alcaligenes sp. SORT26]|uniref:EAL domain-containing protein n=1 Tax=Alcaligenes sp. SORT26 TaxID=2813780 RepID=UPI001A9F6CD5|nr:EAL domain-containing protein [Alcaligenes sp. SORT26]QTC01527.1 EAL domain-containing protein [Alcaligenes sp. SORT26]
MGAASVEFLSCWLQQVTPSNSYLLLGLRSAESLAQAYDAHLFRQAFLSAIQERLRPYGVVRDDILVLDHAVLISLSDCRLPSQFDKDLFLERVKAALCYEPVQCGSDSILVNAVLAWVEASVDQPVCLSHLHSLASTIAFSEVQPPVCAQTRNDMALASRFFADMRDEKVALSFQPVVLVENHQQILYYELLLRWGGADERVQPASCALVVQAIERLHCTERLDASVLWAAVQILERNPDIHLACNISPLSLQSAPWWRLLIAVLNTDPQLARRLTLEITETAAVFDQEAAASLLRTLRKLGCKVAIDDIGAGFNTLDLARQVRPHIIKIDKALVHQAWDKDGIAALNSWVHASRGISQYVIAEGIETALDYQLSVEAGVHAVQGYLIAPPSVQPPWEGAAPLCVQDSFNPTHTNFAFKKYSLKDQEQR